MAPVAYGGGGAGEGALPARRVCLPVLRAAATLQAAGRMRMSKHMHACMGCRRIAGLGAQRMFTPMQCIRPGTLVPCQVQL